MTTLWCVIYEPSEIDMGASEARVFSTREKAEEGARRWAKQLHDHIQQGDPGALYQEGRTGARNYLASYDGEGFWTWFVLETQLDPVWGD
jgi:hypothetical protein